jgi:chromosomal replication initiator protein
METIHDAWRGILQYLREMEDVSEVAYNTWLSCLEPRGIEDGQFVVFVHTNFQRRIIQDCYLVKIAEAAQAVLGMPLSVTVLSGEEQAESPPPVPVLPAGGQKDAEYEYSFENFVVGPSNKFAHAASQAVASKPGGYYNPLFIHGGSGLGKTHLLYAICNEIRKNDPDNNIIYTKGETLTNELINAIKNGQTAQFRAKYRQADVLLVDDIQFIAGKESTQTEFFHTFDDLHQSKKQIVLTSDRPPREIASLEERMRNRFEMGLLADIQPPDLETRIAIIKRKAFLLDIVIPDELCEYIANQLKSNVRQLEGTVRRIFAHELLAGEKPSLSVAQMAIRDIRNNSQPEPVTVDRIISETSRTFNVTPEDIRSDKHSAAISQARQVAIYVVRHVTSMPMKSIGKEFGNRDHSTVVYALGKVTARMEHDYTFKGMISDIIKNVSSTL